MGKKKFKNTSQAAGAPTVSDKPSSRPVTTKYLACPTINAEPITIEQYQQLISVFTLLTATMTKVMNLAERKKNGVQLTEEEQLSHSQSRKIFTETVAHVMRSTGFSVPETTEYMSSYCEAKGNKKPHLLETVNNLYDAMQKNTSLPDPIMDARLEGEELDAMWAQTKRFKAAARQARLNKACEEAIERWCQDAEHANGLIAGTENKEQYAGLLEDLRATANALMKKHGRRYLATTPFQSKLPALFIALDDRIKEYYCRPWGSELGDVLLDDFFHEALDWQNDFAIIGESIWKRELVKEDGTSEHTTCQGMKMQIELDGSSLRERGEAACDECIEMNRVCWMFDGNKAIMLPIPRELRSTQNAKEIGYWLRDPASAETCFDPCVSDENAWVSDSSDAASMD